MAERCQLFGLFDSIHVQNCANTEPESLQEIKTDYVKALIAPPFDQAL